MADINTAFPEDAAKKSVIQIACKPPLKKRSERESRAFRSRCVGYLHEGIITISAVSHQGGMWRNTRGNTVRIDLQRDVRNQREIREKSKRNQRERIVDLGRQRAEKWRTLIQRFSRTRRKNQ
jgi:hypothetical protein